jgi:hypothetical protein
VWDGFSSWIKDAWNGWLGNVLSIFSPIVGIVRNWDDITKWFSSTWNKITTLFGQAVDGFMKFVNDPWGTIKNTAKGAFSKVSEFFGFNEGGKVPGSGTGDTVPAMLTPGEIVVSKNKVDDMGANGVTTLPGNIIMGKNNSFERHYNGGIAGVTSYVAAKPVGGKEIIYGTPSNQSNGNVSELRVNDINLNVGGTIRLELNGNSQNVDVRALLNDVSFVSALKDIIKDSIASDINGGRIMNDTARMAGYESQSRTVGRLT